MRPIELIAAIFGALAVVALGTMLLLYFTTPDYLLPVFPN